MKHVVITIGRKYGSGGRLIAKQLSEEPGITSYDKELIMAVIRKIRFSENLIRGSEYQRPTNSFLYNLYTAVQTPSVPDQVFIIQARVIKEAASRESRVIVGQCIDYILWNDSRRLNAFVHTPLDERVRRTREEYGVQESNPEGFVLRQGEARASYYSYSAAGEWSRSREYDLYISSYMGIAAAVAVIKAVTLTVASGTGA